MNDMNKLRMKFNEDTTIDGRKGYPEGEAWSLLFKRQALIFDAMVVVFNEIQVMKKG